MDLLKLQIERDGEAVRLKVPSLEGHPALERALSHYHVRKLVSRSSEAGPEGLILEARRTSWKSALFHIQDAYEEAAEILALSPKPPLLVFEVDGELYPDVRHVPRDEGFTLELGAFELSQPTLRVTDPCYSKDTWCTLALTALPGTWRANAEWGDDGIFGYRVARLVVAHESIGQLEYSTFELVDGEAGVDSGQCGFFDDAKYPADELELEYRSAGFYRPICDLLSSEGGGREAAIIPGDFGVASQTFYGDGGYPCRVLRNADGVVVAAYLWYAPYADPFFPDDGDYEDEEDDE